MNKISRLIYVFAVLLNVTLNANCEVLNTPCRDGEDSEICEALFNKSKFSGELKNGKFIGKSERGSRYEGEISSGKMHGRGILYFYNGGHYDGEFKNGLFHGKGRRISGDGRSLEGDFIEGEFTGYGIFKSSNSIKIYEGHFKNFKYDGRGQLHDSKDGKLIYSGEFLDGSYFGPGISYEKDGSRYEGIFKNNKKEGEGVFYDPTGKIKLKGTWAQDKLINGTQYYPDGAFYEGEFHNELRHGRGIYTYPTGARYEGEYKEHVKHGPGKFFSKDGNIVFDGEYRNGDMFFGTIYYNSGSKYTGEFSNGKRHGKGVLYDSAGKVVMSGTWDNDENVVDREFRAMVNREKLEKQKISDMYGQQCEISIRNRYSNEREDKYGNKFEYRVSNLTYYGFLRPGTHKFGNNNALSYVAIRDSYEGGRIRNRESLQIFCIVDSKGKVLGIERKYD